MKKTALSEGHKARLEIDTAAAETTQEEAKNAAQQADEVRKAMYELLIETSEYGVLKLQKHYDAALLHIQAVGGSMIQASRLKLQFAKTWERAVIVMAQSIVKKAISALKKTDSAVHELVADSLLFGGPGLEGLISKLELVTGECEAWDLDQDVKQKEDASAIC
jgi:hypothetical protein